MGFWGRIFGEPPEATRADSALAALPPHETALALRSPADVVRPPETPDIIDQMSHVWRTYPADGITPERYRGMQRLADMGWTSQLMELYDDIANDYQVSAQLRTRKLAVAGAPLLLESGDGSDAGQKIADDAMLFWEKVPQRKQMLVDLLDAFFRAFACVRPIWDSVDGKWQIVHHEAIESRYFRFENAVTPLITPTPGTADGVPIPEGYLFHTFRDKAGPLTRGGAGRSIGKLWLHKGYMLVDLASYLERFGTPHVQVKMDRTLKEGDPALQRAKDAARSFIRDQVGVLPAGATIEVIEAVNKAATVRDVYLAAMSFCDMGISKAIVGQVLTADAGPGGIGHGGAAAEQGEVRQDLKEFDADQLAEMLQYQVFKPWTLYHYGPLAPVPKVSFNVAKPEDKVQATLAQKQRAETINILRGAGLPISKSECYEEFDLTKPAGTDDALEPPQPPPPTTTGDPSGTVAPPGGKAPPSSPAK